MYITKVRLARKVREWVIRYGPAEIGGTVAAFAGAYVSLAISDSLAAAAIAGTIGEGVGFYGVAASREAVRYWRSHHGHTRVRRAWLTGLHTLRGMMVEFGPAEIVDSFAVRPGLLYIIPFLMGEANYAIAFLIAKITADLVFYGFAIIGYEVRRRFIENAPTRKPQKIA
ncbi:MAG TPA: hypothetical protein VLF43_04270 [Candidatus Saccharimonadales bacterium]|nr:hypothetical protein [Candidatus Saccharimonadales bacterium]